MEKEREYREKSEFPELVILSTDRSQASRSLEKNSTDPFPATAVLSSYSILPLSPYLFLEFLQGCGWRGGNCREVSGKELFNTQHEMWVRNLLGLTLPIF